MNFNKNYKHKMFPCYLILSTIAQCYNTIGNIHKWLKFVYLNESVFPPTLLPSLPPHYKHKRYVYCSSPGNSLLHVFQCPQTLARKRRLENDVFLARNSGFYECISHVICHITYVTRFMTNSVNFGLVLKINTGLTLSKLCSSHSKFSPPFRVLTMIFALF